MPTHLLVVDVQQGFINAYTRHGPRSIVRLIQKGDFDTLLFTRFINTQDSHYHALLNWHECEGPPQTCVVPELDDYVQRGHVFDKHGLAGLPPELKDYLRDNKVQQLTLVGIDTDMCVLKCAMDAFDVGVEPIVLIDCCASTAGLQAHLAGLSILSRNIGPLQLRWASIGDMYLAAPPD